MIPTPAQYAYLGLIRKTIVAWPTLAWVKPSWIMAEIAIESGFDPLVVNATGRQDGLMQVIPGTVAEVIREYQTVMAPDWPQTEPAASIETGALYFNTCARKIIAARRTTSLYLAEVAEAYNVGWAGFISGTRNQRYGLKMLAAQAQWGFVDNPASMTIS